MTVVEPAPADVLVIWTVYWSPSDFPGEYVARPHVVAAGGKTYVGLRVKRGATLQSVRDQLPHGLTRFPRSDFDEPQICESWM